MKKGNERSGAKALVESLESAGVEIVFGYPGGAVLDIFDCLPDASFRFVLGRHEQGSTHMADGYARASGKPGVCIVTSGPGATNAITGLATANLDGVPMVVVTGQVPLCQIGTDAFQEADMQGISRAVTKHNFLVQSADEIPETIAEAFYIATHGKPGPVVVDIPKDCQQAMTSAQYPTRVHLRAYHPEHTPDTRAIARLAKMLNTAKRPVLYAGGGAVSGGASEELSNLARKADIPVATTLMGLGAFDESDPLSLGLAGMHGSPEANLAIDNADLIVALGVRFSDRITGKVSEYAKRAKIVHVDCDASSVNKNVRVELGIVADVRDVLATVDARVRPACHAKWRTQVEEFRRKNRAEPARRRGFIHPVDAIEALDRLLGPDDIVATDVGQHQMWCAQHLTHRVPRRFLTSGGMGTMGFGIPAAIGAQLACPSSRVVAVCGDGGAQMTFEEVVVAVEQKLPVTFVVINNGCLGMVRQWQELFYRGRYSATLLGKKGEKYLPDFPALAKAHGATAWRVADPAELDSVLERAVKSRRTCVVEVVVDPDANVYPMIPAGQTVREMRIK